MNPLIVFCNNCNVFLHWVIYSLIVGAIVKNASKLLMNLSILILLNEEESLKNYTWILKVMQSTIIPMKSSFWMMGTDDSWSIEQFATKIKCKGNFMKNFGKSQALHAGLLKPR
jgi:hypothetical protein